MNMRIPLLERSAITASGNRWLSARRSRDERRHDAPPLATPAAEVEHASQAPAFNLTDLAGRTFTLTGLLIRGNPVMLVFFDPRCGPCYDLLPDVAGWQRVYHDRLTIALITAGSADDNRSITAEFNLHTVLIQTESLADQPSEVARAFGVDQLPAAVVIGPDGIQRGETAFGAPAVRQMAADTLGLAMPPVPVREMATLRLAQHAPAMSRTDLDGNLVHFAETGDPTLLLFLSPGCTACEQLRPEIKLWETWGLRWRMVIISRGPQALNRAAGFSAPIVLDDDRSVASAFGVTGTPAAIVLDANGRVATEVARGARAVRLLIGGRLAALSDRL